MADTNAGTTPVLPELTGELLDRLEEAATLATQGKRMCKYGHIVTLADADTPLYRMFYGSSRNEEDFPNAENNATLALLTDPATVLALVAAARERDALKVRLQSVVRNLQYVETPPVEGEPGPLCGPVWSKVSYVFAVGSTTAKAMCREFGVDPDFDCGEEQKT